MAEYNEIVRQAGGILADALGESWEHIPSDEAGMGGHVAVLRHAAGPAFILRYGQHAAEKDRWIVTPHYGVSWQHIPKDSPRITVAQGRAPEAIVKDLQRRFIPALFTAWQAAQDSHIRHLAAEAARDEALEVWADALGQRVNRGHGTPRVYWSPAGRGYGDIEAGSDGSGHFNLRGVPRDLADKIIACLAEHGA